MLTCRTSPRSSPRSPIPTRRAALQRLAYGPATATQLEAVFRLNQNVTPD